METMIEQTKKPEVKPKKLEVKPEVKPKKPEEMYCPISMNNHNGPRNCWGEKCIAWKLGDPRYNPPHYSHCSIYPNGAQFRPGM